MIRFLPPLILLAITFVLARRYIANSSSAEQKKSRKITLALLVFAALMIVLALLHRMHWVAALIATLAPIARILINSARDHLRNNPVDKNNGTPAASTSGHISEEEALQILGLNKPFTETEVTDAHRRLMQKFHPDRGGNDYLASRINQAKDLLLKNPR